jgi:hypothetical protein
MELKRGHWSRGIQFTVGTSAKYAIFVHEGTRAHPIVPRRAKRLVFYNKKRNRISATQYVMHPGTRGNPWLTRAMEMSMRMWQRGG